MSDSTSATSGQEPRRAAPGGHHHSESTTQAQAAAGTPTIHHRRRRRAPARAGRGAARRPSTAPTCARSPTPSCRTERLQRRVTELEAEREAIATRDRERAIRLAALEAAARLGFRDPDLAVRLVDPSAVELQGRRDAQERGAPARRGARPLALPRPAGAAPTSAVASGTGPSGTDMNSLIRRAAGRT